LNFVRAVIPINPSQKPECLRGRLFSRLRNGFELRIFFELLAFLVRSVKQTVSLAHASGNELATPFPDIAISLILIFDRVLGWGGHLKLYSAQLKTKARCESI
jgi:hypothetical protein